MLSQARDRYSNEAGLIHPWQVPFSVWDVHEDYSRKLGQVSLEYWPDAESLSDVVLESASQLLGRLRDSLSIRTEAGTANFTIDQWDFIGLEIVRTVAFRFCWGGR